MPHFDVYQPNGKKFRLFYKSDDNKNDLLNETLLKHWSDYLDDHWIWLKAYDPYKMNFEDKTKALLDRCGTFLLLGNFGYGNIIKNISDISSVEVPFSQSLSNDESELETVDYQMLPYNEENFTHTKPHQKAKDKIEKKYKDSQSFKINRLFNFEGKEQSIIVKLKNKDVYNGVVPKNIEQDKITSWKNKIFKNIYGDPVFELDCKSIPPRGGILNKNIPYTSKWCYVDTNNVFVYNNMKYKINNNVTQYMFDCKNEIYNMDKILVYEQNNKLYFFDMNIDQIEDKYIMKTEV